jgi:2-deoxy-D-gluconate 3-dehydrogenase
MTFDAFSLNSFSLTGKTALVAGGTGAIGQAIAIGLARAGANVTVVGRREMGNLNDATAGAGLVRAMALEAGRAGK